MICRGQQGGGHGLTGAVGELVSRQTPNSIVAVTLRDLKVSLHYHSSILHHTAQTTSAFCQRLI